jgi:hypothetical protein
LLKRKRKEKRNEGQRRHTVIALSHMRLDYATRTGAGSSSGRAVIDSPAPVLLGAGAISGSGICMSSCEKYLLALMVKIT